MTINLTSVEAERLKKYCSATRRPDTNVIRELVRPLLSGKTPNAN
ncbi:CopG family transcriptional regulator [Nostoc sp. FACHB-152]